MSPPREAQQCRHRPRRADPRGPCGRRGSRARCQAFQNIATGDLLDHAANDRPAQPMTPMRVLSVASEIFPIIKTGGLADVAGALPIALKAKGIEVRTLVPGYLEVLHALEGTRELGASSAFAGGARLLQG